MKEDPSIPTLRFVGHKGELWQPKSVHPRSMFIMDANVVLLLLRHHRQPARLPDLYQRLLLTTRSRVRLQWHDRGRFIPINPTLAAMELSKQHTHPNYDAFDSYFSRVLSDIYLIHDVAPQWKRDCYDAACRLVEHQFASTVETVEAAFRFMPERTTSNQLIINSVDAFCGWIEEHWPTLCVVGGPPLFLAIQAFAGSAEARRVLKVERAKRDKPGAVAQNVAWDFMYFAHRELSYLSNQYKNDVFCTSDEALANLLKMKIHIGPRFSPDTLKTSVALPTSGHFFPLPSGSIDESEKIAMAIEQRLIGMWKTCSAQPDIVAIT